MHPQTELEQAIKDNNQAQESLINGKMATPQNITDLPLYQEITNELKAQGNYKLLYKVIDLLGDVLELTSKKFLEMMRK